MFSKFVDSMKSVLSIFNDRTSIYNLTSEDRYIQYGQELSEREVSKIFLKSNLIQRIVETIPELALECEIIINSDSEDKIDKELLAKRFRDWKIKDRFFEATISARIYRESYLILVVDDNTLINQPINWNKCKGLSDVIFVEYGGLTVIWNDQQTERINYKIRKEDGVEITIHPERVLLFSGKKISPKLQAFNDGTHQSQVESSVEAYNAYVTSLNESNNLLSRLITFVFKMGNLRDFLTADPVEGIQSVQSRLREHKKSIGGLGGLCIDKETEEVEWISYSLAGVSDLINKTKEFFIANTELTHDQVMNEGSHSTASNLEDKNTQRKIQSFIRNYWAENLNTICQVITCEFYPSKYDVLFSLELPQPSLSLIDTVSAKYTQAQTDNIYFSMGILNQATLQESRFASSTPWEISLVNPGVFEPLPSNNETTTNADKTKTDKAVTSKKKKDSQFTDAIVPEIIDYQITDENIESILKRLKDTNELVFAFVEADIDNGKEE